MNAIASHHELETRKPHAPHQVRRRYPLLHARGEHGEDTLHISGGWAPHILMRSILVPEIEHVENQRGCLVDRVVGAMSIDKMGALELVRSEFNQLRHRRTVRCQRAEATPG